MLKLIECPRDAWQGLSQTIPTAEKVSYLHQLITCGFHHIDAVSFVSPKYVPQMADSEAVMAELSAAGIAKQGIEIIGIVVNEKGIERALKTPGVTTVGYPHSLSAKFLESNAHTTIDRSRALVATMVRETQAAARDLVVYISMAFGNPYGDPWSLDLLAQEISRLAQTGVRQISLADTVGLASPEQIHELLVAVLPAAEEVEIGVHLHSRPDRASEKVSAAWEAGCRRFDSALTGLGGCPFAGDDLLGNIPTEIVISTLEGRGESTGIAPRSLDQALEATLEFRRRYAPH
ncbi:MAG: hydroxymethylglutaryl-CoA lyase [Acidobacteriota bacterium]|nr:hydroxymethylglutaryl-CoA lyase [Acidobacteriota bacterium]